MATKTIFHPYKVINQSSSSLELGSRSHLTMWLFRLLPLLVPVFLFIVLLSNGTDVPAEVMYIIIGCTLFMYLVFVFVKMPAAVTLDSLGMSVTTVSVLGHKEQYILWSDIDRIEQTTQRTKNGRIYHYKAVTTTNKKIRFLQFSGIHFSKDNIPQITNTLQQISHKQVISR